MSTKPFIVAAAVLCALGAQAQTVVTIGYAGALTGAQAHFGKDSERGIRLAMDEINATHPVIGGKPVQFALDAQDDAADPRIATTIAQRFVDNRVSAVIGHQNSGTSIAVARLYAQQHIAELTPSATNPEFTRLGFNTTFRMLANDDFLGEALSRYVASQLGARRIAVIDDRTAYGQGIAEVFARQAEKAGAKIVAREFSTDKAFDFSAVLTRVKRENPEVIFFGGMDAQGGPMLKQMRQYSIRAPLVGGDGLCTAEMVRLAGTALDGNLFCADGGHSLARMPGGQAFAAKFKARYGEPVQLYAPYAYDAMTAIYRAAVAVQSTDASKIVDALHRVSFGGVTGHIAFDEHGDLRAPAATISTYKEGKKMALTEVSK
ncbi:branched chain amino acid ABC transporter substrate-binding protein [Pandoraea pulmonicola]|uniref:Branched chain amino acid ABC transporter substrate-binding protein n=2 Tax=Pandoraea pulmonicola TaxID=93221 RepID=A0AAJ5D2U8_PANPU|nr:branched-chain amino acid ABC transporter substrate-binding protein [Pandoraea pulmonicola]AJC22749.2 branched chain amino acid ABC transporter substrate-binding protein [Pandoraea pulmonicola]SUA92990.1 Leucine-, isoleucine-, valine-, threonine-, and alanine-binding protein precursor [Pandoraea pulmonicola]